LIQTKKITNTDAETVKNRRIPAVFMRGGTSKALVFHARDLPADCAARDRLFCHVMGSPDAYGRQLDGMGGGLSSLSKIVIVEPSERPGIDIDYTFVQIAVDAAIADYSSMCGNMSASVGPFAVDEGLVNIAAIDTEASVSIYNTNTDKQFTARFPVADGKSVETGDFSIPGVSGTGACIQLDYREPGGAATGKLLPADAVVTELTTCNGECIRASLVDSSNPVAFVRAADLGKTATELPQDLDADKDFMHRMETIRKAASVAMGLSDTEAGAARGAPKVAIVAEPDDFTALNGETFNADEFSIAVRIISMGNVHRAITLTGAMCVATAVKIPGTIPHQTARDTGTTIIGNPSGLLPVEAVVQCNDGFHAVSATTYRTQRRLMEGLLPLPPLT
jgi:2-methylaconitate cis-trans-isomerase PrpF